MGDSYRAGELEVSSESTNLLLKIGYLLLLATTVRVLPDASGRLGGGPFEKGLLTVYTNNNIVCIENDYGRDRVRRCRHFKKVNTRNCSFKEKKFFSKFCKQDVIVYIVKYLYLPYGYHW